MNDEFVRRAFGGRLPDLPTFIRASQLLQSAGLRYAIEADRRRMFRCSGTIPWQLHDPWPNLFSTAAIDHRGDPKGGFFAVAAAYAPLAPTARVATMAWGGRERFSADLFVANAEGPRTVRLDARVIGADGRVTAEIAHESALAGSGVTAFGEIGCPLDDISDDVFFLDLELRQHDRWSGGSRYAFSRTVDLGSFIDLQRTAVEITRAPGILSMRNAGSVAALAVRIEDPRSIDAPGWLQAIENDLTLLPGERRDIAYRWHAAPDGPVRAAAWNADPVVA
jgi:beta-mannosidase